MDVIEIRHRNLLFLLEQLTGRGITRTKDAAQALGGLGSSYLSQMKGGKTIGEDTARRIEKATYKPHGWMDQPQWSVSEGKVADSVDLDRAAEIAKLMELLPSDERALLENYRAAGDAGKAAITTTSAAVEKQQLQPRRRA